MIPTVLWAALAGSLTTPGAAPPAQATDTIDPARRIIAAAIGRKHERRSTHHDYQYRADVKLVLQDLDQSLDSAASIAAITETQSAAYWQPPDRCQKTILARRRMGSVGAGGNLVAVREIVNFNRERIELGRYSLVSPLADDALDSYRYRIVYTFFRDDVPRRTYRLAVEPRTNASPLFVGFVDIVDSTFDVASINVGVNDVVQFPFITKLRYQVSLRDLGNNVWMPDDIRLTGDVTLKLPVVHLTVPIPGFPRRGTFEQVAALTDFRFAEGHPPKISARSASQSTSTPLAWTALSGRRHSRPPSEPRGRGSTADASGHPRLHTCAAPLRPPGSFPLAPKSTSIASTARSSACTTRRDRPAPSSKPNSVAPARRTSWREARSTASVARFESRNRTSSGSAARTTMRPRRDPPSPRACPATGRAAPATI